MNSRKKLIRQFSDTLGNPFLNFHIRTMPDFARFEALPPQPVDIQTADAG